MRKRIITPAPDPNAAQDAGNRRNKGQWQHGTSGNPSGKPPGARNRLLRDLDALGDETGVHLLMRLRHEALFNGDMRAIELLLRRVWPERKGRPVELPLPEIKTIGDLQKANAVVTAAMARGELTPEEALTIANVLNGQHTAQEIADLKAEIQHLKEQFDGLARSH